MTTAFNDIFEKLLNDGSVEVAVAGPDAEGLRVSLVRRWSKHKKDYDALGFLDEDLKHLSLSMKITDAGAQYSLKFRTRRTVYQIIDPTQLSLLTPAAPEKTETNKDGKQ